MLKSLKTFSRCVWAGLLVFFIMGCGGGTLSTSPGGISEDKYYRDASDQFPDPFLGDKVRSGIVAAIHHFSGEILSRGLESFPDPSGKG